MTSGINDTGQITREPGTETAVLAGGCFWGIEDLIRRQPGVLDTRVGYTGGENDHATYRNHPGHAEAVEIVFDPTQTTYRDILAFFFQIHDPSTLNQQGNDIGTSYRSAIFPLTPEQENIARDTIADVDASGLWPGKAVTTIEPAGPFWEAEPEHQDYLITYPNGYTCHFPRPDWVVPRRSRGPRQADRHGRRSVTGTPAATTAESGPSDGSILNFALNLEYLEAEFYLRGATGQGLPDDMVGGTGTPGQVSGGRQVDFRSPLIKNIAREIAMDERAHVAFLRDALGDAAAARPRISLDHSFTAAATAAGLIKPGEVFDAYANDRNFLFAAFLFEDVGVTAFKGAAPFISNKTYLDAAAGLLATEAYHAGIVRATLFSEGLADDSVFDVVRKISAVRNAVSGPADDDQDLGSKGEANLVPTDEYGRAFGRSAAEILNIVYLDPQAGSSGGFYPDGLNGDIVHGTGPTAS